MAFASQYPATLMEDLCTAELARKAIGINEWQDVEYFAREKFRTVSMLLALADAKMADLPLWWQKAELAGYQVAKMVVVSEEDSVESTTEELAIEASSTADSLPIAEMKESPLATEEEI